MAGRPTQDQWQKIEELCAELKVSPLVASIGTVLMAPDELDQTTAADLIERLERRLEEAEAR